MKTWIRPALTLLIPGGIAAWGAWYLYTHRAQTGPASSASIAQAPAPNPSQNSLSPVSARDASQPAGNASVYGLLKANGMPVPGSQQVAFNPDTLAASTSTLELPLIN